MNYFNIEIKPILTLSKHKSLCNLITIDGINMMFDCGWNESCSEEIVSIYKEYL